MTFSLSPGHAHDAPEGRRLLRSLDVPDPPRPWPFRPRGGRLRPGSMASPMTPPGSQVYLLMDRAYEGDETRQLALQLGFTPVVPPKQNRISPLDYDHTMYRRRNEIERLFRRLKGFRRIFSRFDKLDVMFIAFIHFALIAEALR